MIETYNAGEEGLKIIADIDKEATELLIAICENLGVSYQTYGFDKSKVKEFLEAYKDGSINGISNWYNSMSNEYVNDWENLLKDRNVDYIKAEKDGKTYFLYTPKDGQAAERLYYKITNKDLKITQFTYLEPKDFESLYKLNVAKVDLSMEDYKSFLNSLSESDHLPYTSLEDGNKVTVYLPNDPSIINRFYDRLKTGIVKNAFVKTETPEVLKKTTTLYADNQKTFYIIDLTNPDKYIEVNKNQIEEHYSSLPADDTKQVIKRDKDGIKKLGNKINIMANAAIFEDKEELDKKIEEIKNNPAIGLAPKNGNSLAELSRANFENEIERTLERTRVIMDAYKKDAATKDEVSEYLSDAHLKIVNLKNEKNVLCEVNIDDQNLREKSRKRFLERVLLLDTGIFKDEDTKKEEENLKKYNEILNKVTPEKEQETREMIFDAVIKARSKYMNIEEVKNIETDDIIALAKAKVKEREIPEKE